jgi:uncharacterized protein (DUF885 family)
LDNGDFLIQLTREDLVAQLGFLEGQILRARRLVVDTGLHAKNGPANK